MGRLAEFHAAAQVARRPARPARPSRRVRRVRPKSPAKPPASLFVNDPTESEPAALVVRALADGRPRACDALARECGIDGATLDAALRRLDGLGVAVVSGLDAVSLPRPVDLLDAQRIRRAVPRLGPEALHVRFAVDSTNSVLAGRLRAGAEAPELCAAEIQTAGRGRQGRRWVSGLGQSLVLSVSWRFPAQSRGLSGVSLAAGIALAEDLAAGGFGGVMLKWPNDLVVDDRKLAGILVEASRFGSGAAACVIGVGFNLDLAPADSGRIDQPWTDFATAFGRVPARSTLASRSANALLDTCEQYRADGPGPFVARWRERDALHGRPVRVLSGGAPIDGTACGIDADGALLVEHSAGVIRCESGEISVRARCRERR